MKMKPPGPVPGDFSNATTATRPQPPNRNLVLKAMKYNENEASEPQPCSKSNEIQ